MNQELRKIIELIDSNLDGAFKKLDKRFGTSNGAYNDLNREYYSRSNNFNIATFRSRLKRFVQMNWDSKENLGITHHQVYLCNRHKQNESFQSHLIEKSKKIYTFFIHGDERHGHEAMSRRFYTDVARNSKIKPLEINLCSIAPAIFRKKLMLRLMEELGINNHGALPQNLGDIYKKIKNETLIKKKVIGVILKIPYKNWFPQEHINWFHNIFCDEQSIPKDAPDFHFYFLVEYRTTTWTGFLRKKKLKKCKEETICKLRATPVIEIDELGGVHYDDIDDWLSNHAGIKNPKKRKQIIKEQLNEAKALLFDYYYMEDLVKPFNKIINRQINTKS